ncbi:MAG: efflux RND transporter periplasmic adaptor subunit [Firmicutes bacterium]|nr:efflux RND transporter periplasmic adaptor subunit [Bacillota bacterium]
MKIKKVYIFLSIFVILIITLFVVNKNRAVDVDLHEVQKGDLDKYVEETGVIKVEGEAAVYSEFMGKISELWVEVGDEVKAGDVLAEFDKEEMYLQLENLKAQKREILARYNETVKPADREEILKLENRLKVAEAELKEIKRLADNSKQLYEEGAISYDEYKKVMNNLTAAEAGFENAKIDLELAVKGVSENIKNQYEASLDQIQSQIELISRKLKDLTIKAPVDGTVLKKEIKEGSYVQQGTEMFVIGDKNRLFIESDILVKEIKDVQEGLPVIIYSEDLGIKAEGYVRKIYPTAFSKISDLGIEQKRVRVEIEISDKDLKVRPGYEVDVRIITERKANILMIPESAVFEYNGKDHVFVNENGRAVLRQIEAGMKSDGKVEILDGLKEGEEVILSPGENLNEGIRVK